MLDITETSDYLATKININIIAINMPLLKYGTASGPATAIEARNTDDFKQRIVDYFCINAAIG